LVKVSVFARSSGYLRLKVTGNEHLTSLFTALANTASKKGIAEEVKVA
jgi:hypothetical protein